MRPSKPASGRVELWRKLPSCSDCYWWFVGRRRPVEHHDKPDSTSPMPFSDAIVLVPLGTHERIACTRVSCLVGRAV
jgi:hypothetical protein